jgi:hypothetical protein
MALVLHPCRILRPGRRGVNFGNSDIVYHGALIFLISNSKQTVRLAVLTAQESTVR